ncbi:MAG: hypothetical protein ACQCN4_03455, partial [Candidatus Bathyarchaeia archaeon]
MYPLHFVHFTMQVTVNVESASESLFHLQLDNCLVRGYKERMSTDGNKQQRSPLMELAVKYFKKEGFKVNGENVMMEGHSGVMRHFDLIVQRGRLEQGVWVRD